MAEGTNEATEHDRFMDLAVMKIGNSPVEYTIPSFPVSGRYGYSGKEMAMTQTGSALMGLFAIAIFFRVPDYLLLRGYHLVTSTHALWR